MFGRPPAGDTEEVGARAMPNMTLDIVSNIATVWLRVT
jgi:hypothetical protein